MSLKVISSDPSETEKCFKALINDVDVMPGTSSRWATQEEGQINNEKLFFVGNSSYKVIQSKSHTNTA